MMQCIGRRAPGNFNSQHAKRRAGAVEACEVWGWLAPELRLEEKLRGRKFRCSARLVWNDASVGALLGWGEKRGEVG